MTRQTSIDVYNAIKNEGLLTNLRFEVYDCIYKHGPMTQMETCRRINGQRQDRSYMPRFAELKTMGVIDNVGEKVCSVTSRNVMNWDVTSNMPTKLTREGKPTRKHLELCREVLMDVYRDDRLPPELKELVEVRFK